MSTPSHKPDKVQPASHDFAEDAAAPAPNPKRQFSSPEILMADETLSDGEKFSLLREWNLDLDNRLKAEEEGMSASDPINGWREARIADEAGRVTSCIVELSGRIDQEKSPGNGQEHS